MDYNVEVLLENNEEFAGYLKNRIKEFNNIHSAHHKNVRKAGSTQYINIIVSQNSDWVGGISADVYWGWLEINDFWFNEELRGRGFGKTLLQKTEEIAIDKGAQKSLLTTFDFQARNFYTKYGYEVVGEIKDYPPGSSYFTMVKTLVKEGTGWQKKNT
ncbi:GNAT family N-acetyltransferase [Virgibacillus kekensis]|uniref:GNAT family N-acetyltransferase n=1 Tax=Virgibacillus kekensis TaxID=202261 RepID=A0ABV9DMU7_9BACI